MDISFSTDTEEDITNRIAVLYDTLPELLIKNKNDELISMENIIKTYTGDLDAFMKEYYTIIKENSIPIDLFINLWLLYNKESYTESFQGYPNLYHIVQSYDLKISLSTIISDMSLFKKNFETKKEKFSNKVKLNDVFYSLLKDVKPQSHSLFKKQKYKADIATSINNMSLQYIFSIIRCNDEIPFCLYNNICKISSNFKEYTLLDEWNEQFKNDELNDHKILLKINIGKNYIDTFLSITDKSILQVEANIYIDLPFDITTFITKIFTIPISFNKVSNEYDIDGIIFYPNQKFNKYIFSDMIMNNPIISKFIDVDESIKASTQKTGLLIKFKGAYNKKYNKLIDTSCNIICKKVIPHDPDLKDIIKLFPDSKDKNKLFQEGSYYTRVRLTKFKDEEMINYFITLLSKFLTLYHESPIITDPKYNILVKYKLIQERILENEKELIKKYKTFLPKLDYEKDEDKKDLLLKNKEINIKKTTFHASGYNRSCEKKRLPKLLPYQLDKKWIETKDLEEYVVDTQPDSNYYINFPKNEDDEENKYNLTCYGNETYPYIGLFENELKNMDKYDYLPCCFRKQENNNNNLDVYYGDKEKNINAQQIIIKTYDRLLEPEIYKEEVLAKNIGYLPDNLSKFLLSIYGSDNTDNITFYRQGISKDKHSFLDCIKFATKQKTSIDMNTIAISSQENPDLSLTQMKQLIKNKSTYFEPQRWIKLLEYTFKCNIHVFCNYGKSKESTYMIPYHSGPYLQYKSTFTNTVLVLENKNKKTNELRCELIIMRKNEKEDIQLFTPLLDKPLFTQFYFISQKQKPLITYSTYPVFIKPFTSQILDSNKKIRCLISSLSNGHKIYLLCNPIPPLALPIEEEQNISFENDRESVNQLLEINIPLDKLSLQIGIFTILIKDKDSKDKNIINIYTKNRKVAIILGEFFIYSYSVYAYKNNKEIDNVHTIKSFIDQYIIVKETIYNILPSPLINTDMKIYGYLSPSNKLIVTNKETLKRLICLLRLRLINSFEEVYTYHSCKEFLHFYQQLDDYESFDNIILYSSNLYFLNKPKNIVYSELQDFSTYFLRIKKHIFIISTLTDNQVENMIFDKKIKDKQNIIKYIEENIEENPKLRYLYEYEPIDKKNKKYFQSIIAIT